MNWALCLSSLVLLVSATPAAATDYLTSVESEVFQTPGTPREIAARARICMSQVLTAGTVNGDVIISSDLDDGIIVARSALKYGSLPEWEIRSRFTFEAREGRFRITQTNLERFNDMAGGWGPIGKWPGSQWKGAENAFQLAALNVALCVTSKRQDW